MDGFKDKLFEKAQQLSESGYHLSAAAVYKSLGMHTRYGAELEKHRMKYHALNDPLTPAEHGIVK